MFFIELWRLFKETLNNMFHFQACTICGMILVTYALACDHYQRIHGRNVLMCPYCGQYFLQSNLLTKHVLAMHSKVNDCVGLVSVLYYSKFSAESNWNCIYRILQKKNEKQVQKTENNIDECAVRSSSVENQLTDSVLPSLETSASIETSISMEPSCNEPSEETTIPVDEPLNLCLKKADNQTNFDSGTIDLTTGALDLSFKK